MTLLFSSKVQKQFREAVEELFFLNPRQSRVHEGIVRALEKFGEPRLEEKDDSVFLRVGDQGAQTLFAFDSSRKDSGPVGVVVFLRTSWTEIIVVHIAVHPTYALRGSTEGPGLGLELIEKVEEIASRLAGVEKVVLWYQNGITLRLPKPVR